MEHPVSPVSKTLLIALCTGMFLVLCAVAFRGWMTYGADIFLSMAQSGMAWCL